MNRTVDSTLLSILFDNIRTHYCSELKIHSCKYLYIMNTNKLVSGARQRFSNVTKKKGRKVSFRTNLVQTLRRLFQFPSIGVVQELPFLPWQDHVFESAFTLLRRSVRLTAGIDDVCNQLPVGRMSRRNAKSRRDWKILMHLVSL